MLNALPARKILLSTLKVWESGAGVKTVTSVRSVMDPLHWRKLGIVRMFGSNVTDVIYLQSTMAMVGSGSLSDDDVLLCVVSQFKTKAPVTTLPLLEKTATTLCLQSQLQTIYTKNQNHHL